MESFIATIARMTQDGEERAGDTEPFVMENDDAVSTLNWLRDRLEPGGGMGQAENSRSG